MGLILELYQPGLRLAVDGYGGLYRAGVYLVAHVQVGYKALLSKVLAADGSHVHQGYRAVSLAVELVPQGKVVL